MTTETERRVREHPGWQPWWLRYAEYEGEAIALTQRALLPAEHVAHLIGTHEYMVFDPKAVGPCDWCSWPYGRVMRPSRYEYCDSLAEAEAAFELACERLREGG